MKCVLFAGQSLPAAMFTATAGTPPTPRPGTHLWNGSSWGAVTGDGAIEYANMLNATLNEDIYLINAAVGGTALLQNNANPAGTYWLNTAPGSLVNNAIAQVQAALASVPGLALNRIEWWQGQQDCNANAYPDTYLPYLAGLGTLLGLFQAALGSAFRFCVWPIGHNAGGSTGSKVRAQMVFATSTPGVEPGPASYDLTYVDGTHLDGGSYRLMGDRGAANALASFAGISGGAGPRITDIWRSGGPAIVLLTTLKPGECLQPRNIWAAGDVTIVTGFTLWWFNLSAQLHITSSRIVGNRIVLTSDMNLVYPVRVGYQWDTSISTSVHVYDSQNTFYPGWGQPLLPLTGEMLVSL